MELALSLSGFSNLVIKRPKEFFGGFLAHMRDHFIPHHRNNYHPHILSHRMSSLWAILLVAVKVFTFSYVSLGPVLPAFSSAILPENIISLTNESRKNFGLKALEANSVLSQAAQAKASDMAKKGYFAHTSPDGRVPWDFIKAAGYEYIMAGENLAVNFIQAESVSEAWMNSPTHKANILNKNFEEIGIGIAEGQYSGKSSIFIVQMFGVPSTEKISLKNESTKVETSSAPEPKAPVPTPIPAPAPAVLLASDSKPDASAPEKVTADPLIAAAPHQTAESAVPAMFVADVSIESQDELYVIKAKASAETVKVLAIYGQKAGMLLPKGGGVWEVSLPMQNLSGPSQKLTIRAFDINGRTAEKAAATFSNSPIANYNFTALGEVAGKNVEVFGKNLNLPDLEDRFYLLFAAAVLTCLILAIAIKRHILHISLVANGSFLGILAMLLWMG